MSELNYCVYKHTSPNGKSYIGQTNNYKRRCNSHKSCKVNTAFTSAIKKHGWNNFKHEVLKDNLTIDESNYWEELLIKEHNTLSPNGYNLVNGGLNKKVSEETRKKISLNRLGKKSIWTNEHREAHLIAVTSIEYRNKMSNSLKGRKQSDDAIRKSSLTRTGTKRTELQKINISLSLIGRKQSEQQKEKHRLFMSCF